MSACKENIVLKGNMLAILDEAALELVAYGYGTSRSSEFLRRSLSEVDMASYRVLETILCPPEANYDEEYDEEKAKLSLAEAFKSPLYSDDSKKYFAAAHLSEEVILLVASKFITEKIIFSHIESTGDMRVRLPYLAVLMGSEHLSGRILEVVLSDANYRRSRQALAFIPDAMITPGLMKS